MKESNELDRIVPIQERHKRLLCKLGIHKYSIHHEISVNWIKFKVCAHCGKWWHGKDPKVVAKEWL